MGTALSSEGDSNLGVKFQWIEQFQVSRPECCETKCQPRSGDSLWQCCTASAGGFLASNESQNDALEWDVNFTEAQHAKGPAPPLTPVNIVSRKRAPPTVLVVTGKSEKVDGIYKLVSNEKWRGCPMWRKSPPHPMVIYMGQEGKWKLTTEENVKHEKHFMRTDAGNGYPNELVWGIPKDGHGPFTPLVNVRIVAKVLAKTSRNDHSTQHLQKSDDPQTPRLPSSYGPQSKRGNAQQFQLDVLQHNAHAKTCFDEMQQKEEEMWSDWAVFYHSYTHAALLYEVQAAMAAVLFGYPSDAAPLPRIRVTDFQDIPDATTLKKRFGEEFSTNMKDHHPVMRAVAISVMCSIVSKGPEVSTPVVFIGGYKHSDDPVPYRVAMEELLWCCRAPERNKKAAQREMCQLADTIVDLAEEYGLDVAQYRFLDKNLNRTSFFGGLNVKMAVGKDLERAGHMLQVFVRRDLVDRLAYAAEPWGAVCEEVEPISAWLDGDTDTSWGQARLLAHPEFFMNTECVRMFTHSAGPEFHAKRWRFQQQLIDLLKDFLSIGTRHADAVAALSVKGNAPI